MQFQQFLKRQMDFWGACLLLLLFAIPFLVIAVFIKSDSKGSVLFIQGRAGKYGKVFNIFKFRTMVENAANMGAGIEIEQNDFRITRVGKWLRRFRIDEFPQLFQVVKGQMSLVGPRPGLPHQALQYTQEERKRLEVKPGMASIDMLKGGNLISWKERIQWDLWYIDHWSLWLDIKIIWGTFWTILLGRDEGVVKDYK